MPVIRPFFTSSHPQALALAAQANEEALAIWAKKQGRFPKRNVAKMPTHRQLEHFAVDTLLVQMGFTDARLQIVHDSNGKPFIQSLEADLSSHSLSISHCTEGDLCHAFIAMGEGKIGCDIENERDALRRIARRAFVPEEGNPKSPISDLAVLWTMKESMFKAFGPSLDFRKDLRVAMPSSWKESKADSWTCTGVVQGHTYEWQVWRAHSPVNEQPLWLCCGPLGKSSTQKK